MKPSHYDDVGRYLHDSRESLHIPLEDAARALHLSPKYLHAIETGRLEDLPGRAYIRGYIRNYAIYLRLPEEEVIAAYEAKLGPKKQEFFVPEPTLKENLPSRGAIRWALLGIVFLWGYWFFALHDRSAGGNTVSELPQNLARLLDKSGPAAMDRAWEDCVTSGDVECFLRLRAQRNPPFWLGWYDIDPVRIAAQEPQGQDR